MSILVEGVDGAGKTTLIQRLQYDFPQLKLHPRFAASLTGPLDNLATRVYEDQSELITGRWIYDRHPVISEYVYGQVIPAREVAREFLSPAMFHVYRRIVSESFVIWCHPPFDFIKQNVEAEEQMPGVVENLRKLYDAYAIQRVTWAGDSVSYDYSDDRSYLSVYEKVRAHYHYKGLPV